MDSFPEDATNTRVNFYGSALDSNEEDNDEEELHVDVTYRGEIFQMAIAHGPVLNLYFVTTP